MKIISFGNSVGFSSAPRKEPEASEVTQNKEEKNSTTDGAKKALGTAFLLTAAGLFSYLAIDTVVLKRFVKKNLGPITETIAEDCKKAYDEAMGKFNDWQKRDFIKAFKKDADKAKDTTLLAAQKIAEIVNIANRKKTININALPDDRVAAFSEVLENWLGK